MSKFLKYDPKNPPQAYIIETKKDRRGAVISAIIKDGKLKVGDIIQATVLNTRVRSMFNDLGKPIPDVVPSMPFELLGFSDLPEVGSTITLVSEFTDVKQKTLDSTKQNLVIPQTVDLESLLHPKPEEKKLSLIIKVDSQGSLEAIKQSLAGKSNIEVVSMAIGDIYKSDIFLAKSTKSIIIGFSVAVSNEAKQLAKQEKIIIKTYNIIYLLLEELEEVANLLKEKLHKEKNLKGSAKILANFLIDKEKIYRKKYC